uniref:Gypsy retrotransposon integrase-like protein 1 n=1 Tax=Oryzias latipes TaxID=8090 RepID=A0A3B3HH14_ORYLA
FPLFVRNMDEYYIEISHYIAKGTYHNLTLTSKNPDSRKATIRKTSKNYTIKNEQLYYNHRGNLRLVVFQAQVCDILRSCHDDIGSGGHHGRRRTLEKVLASYHWKTAREDVMKWVIYLDYLSYTVKTVAPVLHPIQVQEAWSVLGIDLIGPLPTTAKATDLFTKWVVAKSLYTKTATEVSRKIVNILLDFGLVERIITDQGREFVNEALGVKHCITSAYHPLANGQDERTNRNIKTGLSKYCGEDKNDWDIHLRGIVAVNHVYQDRRTETEEHLEQKQKMEYETRKKRNVKSFIFKVGDEVLKANKRKEGRKGGRLEPNWSGPYVIASISEKGVATLSSKAGVQLKQNVNVSHLKPFIIEQEPISVQLVPQQSVHDHDYWPGLGYLQELSPVQAMLVGILVCMGVFLNRINQSESNSEILILSAFLISSASSVFFSISVAKW